MPNMRLVWDNAALRATLSASTQAGSYTASKLKMLSRSKVWRSVGTTATLTLSWPADEAMSCLILPFCNLSPTATVRVRLTNSSASVIHDSGNVLACQAPSVKLIGWTNAQAASAYSYGGGTSAAMWFSKRQVRGMTIDIVDTNNLQGYIEVAGLVTGDYWSPRLNPAWNPSLTHADTGKNSRSEAGSLRSDKGFRFKKLSMNLANLVSADRTSVMDIIKGLGTSNALFVSMFPEDADKSLERDYSMLCKVSQISAVTLPSWNNYSAPLELEQV